MKNLMCHLVAGFPTMKESFELGKLLIDLGAQYLEIQIPFNDPIADGPIISEACRVSVRNGTTVKDCLKLAGRLQKYIADRDTKLIFMSYYNPLFKFGLKDFMTAAHGVGVVDFIIPDLPLEESNFKGFVPVFSTVTRKTRMREYLSRNPSMVYCVSGFGITGSKLQNSSSDLRTLISNIRRISSAKIAVGFGIKTAKQVQEVASLADVVVIGSHVLELNKIGGKNAISSFLLAIH